MLLTADRMQWPPIILPASRVSSYSRTHHYTLTFYNIYNVRVGASFPLLLWSFSDQRVPGDLFRYTSQWFYKDTHFGVYLS